MQFGCLLRHFPGEVALLAGVILQVEQLHALILEKLQQLPIPDTAECNSTPKMSLIPSFSPSDGERVPAGLERGGAGYSHLPG